MLESKFRSFPAISLLSRVGVGGWLGGWGLGKLKLKLTPPQVELEAWLELGLLLPTKGFEIVNLFRPRFENPYKGEGLGG
jgi:hypothetical protein